MMVSLDGFFEGENGDLSWHNTDEEFNEFAIEQTSGVDIIIFGRKTYEMMASYWPKDFANDENPKEIVDLMNNTPKIVFSKTLEKAEWQNTTVFPEVNPEEIRKLKESSEKDIAVFGSSNLGVNLLEKGLLDEVRIMVNPTVLSKGKRLFEGLNKNMSLKLLDTRTFRNGNVLLKYQVVE